MCALNGKQVETRLVFITPYGYQMRLLDFDIETAALMDAFLLYQLDKKKYGKTLVSYHLKFEMFSQMKCKKW